MFAQQTREQCLRDCADRWLDDCPKIAKKIYDGLVARGVPNASATYDQLLEFYDQGYVLCVASCPAE